MIHGLVSVIIPTAGRKTLDAALDSLYTTTYDEYPIQCVVVPNGGYQWFPWEHTISDGSFWCRLIVYDTWANGAIASWNCGLEQADGEYIVMGADDLVFHESWLSGALEALREQTGGIGCVGFNDLHNKDRHQTHFLMHRSFIIEHLGGVLVPPVYRHYQVDTEIIRRAEDAGLYAYARDSIVEHYHPSNGKRPNDVWDIHTGPNMAEDTRTFLKRQELRFPNNYEPVIRE